MTSLPPAASGPNSAMVSRRDLTRCSSAHGEKERPSSSEAAKRSWATAVSSMGALLEQWAAQMLRPPGNGSRGKAVAQQLLHGRQNQVTCQVVGTVATNLLTT